MPIWKALLLLVVAAASAAWGQLPGEDRPGGRDDAAIYRQIERLRRAAANLRLDGRDQDWRTLPQLTDPRGDAQGDDSRDVTALGLAPREDNLWIMIRTAGPPSSDRFVFHLVVDIAGENGDDFQISLETLGQPPVLRPFGKDRQAGEPTPLSNAKVVVRGVVELRIPYGDVAAALPEAKAKLVSGKAARSWVRIRCLTWNGQQRRRVDDGPSAAGFRLLPTPYPLDAPLPPRPAEAAPIDLPVRGQWFVTQGPFGAHSHRKTWAYDLVIFDRNGYQSSPRRSDQNADYYAWGRPVLAPIAGRVRWARPDFEDSPPRGAAAGDAKPNEVYIVSEQGLGLQLGHFQRGGMTVKTGQQVTAGRQVGLVGNSGYSFAPHLHVALWRDRFPRQSRPLAFANVRVGLNPVPDDPWARELAGWEPRFGYFIETMQPPVPDSTTGNKHSPPPRTFLCHERSRGMKR